jgi:hypothetical protein
VQWTDACDGDAYHGRVGIAAVGFTRAGLAKNLDQAVGNAVAADVLSRAVAAGDVGLGAGNVLGGGGSGGHGESQDGEDAGVLHFGGWKGALES